jgi:hypothetical protein
MPITAEEFVQAEQRIRDLLASTTHAVGRGRIG